MRTVTKTNGRSHAGAAKRPPTRKLSLPGPVETVDWDTRINFPPTQEVRTIRARFVEVPARPFEARPDPRD